MSICQYCTARTYTKRDVRGQTSSVSQDYTMQAANQCRIDVLQGNPLRIVKKYVVAPKRFIIRLVTQTTVCGELNMTCCDPEKHKSAFLRVHNVVGHDVHVSIMRNSESKKCVTSGSYAISFDDNNGTSLCSCVVHVHEEPTVNVVTCDVKICLAAHFALSEYDEAREQLQKQTLLWYLHYHASHHKASDEEVREAAALLASHEQSSNDI